MSQPAATAPKKKLDGKKLRSEAGKERYLKISREDGIQTDTEIDKTSATLEPPKARRKKSTRSRDDRTEDSSQPADDDTESFASEAESSRTQGMRSDHLCC
jgi:hypothetical protein